jgi:hypothetical protein
VPAKGRLSIDEAKAKALQYISQGDRVEDAMAKVHRSAKSWSNWRAADKDFAAKADEIRDRRQRAKSAGLDEDLTNLSFVEWRKRFLGMDTYPHMMQWIDVLEGRVPQDLPPSVTYKPGREDRVLLNTPPFHAKSATITRDYITYRLCMNPNYRVIIVSKTQQQAKKFLYSIRTILTSSVYAELQAAYAPAQGFKSNDAQWSQNMIYVAGRDTSEKDPSVEALGIGGQIYGARADLIVLDDAITLGNANSFESQFTWINQEVASRLYGGKLLVVGTRVATTDLYSYLMDGDNYVSGTSPWTYLGQPAVLEYGENPEDWVTLWPYSSKPLDENMKVREDGTFAAWDGPALHKVRESVSPTTWALIYMQQAVAEDATFHPTCVWGSVDKRRHYGPLRAGEWGGRRNGMEGMHVICSIDPASTGEAFAIIYAFDRTTRERWLLDAWMHSGSSNVTLYADLIERWWHEYGYVELAIEKNTGTWLLNDDRVVAFCRDRGIRIVNHYTSHNKNDADWGVATLAPLLGTWRRVHEGGRPVHADDNLLHIPDPSKNNAIKAFIEQLITWRPGRLGRELRQDGPMSWWFAETCVRNLIGSSGASNESHMKIGYLSRGQRARQAVLPTHSFQAVAGSYEYAPGSSRG